MDKTLKILNAETGAEFNSLVGHKERITSWTFSPDSKRIVSVSWDRTLKLWDVNITKELAIIATKAGLTTCAISGCGRKIACGDNTGSIYLFELVGIEKELPVLTGVRLWLFNINMNKGAWDKDITAACSYCGVRIPCTISENAKCNDQGLISKCPKCGGKLRFNPFVVDNKGKWN